MRTTVLETASQLVQLLQRGSGGGQYKHDISEGGYL